MCCNGSHCWRVTAEDDIKSLREAIEGEQVPVDETRAGTEGEKESYEKLKKIFKCGDAELGIGTLVDAAACKGALLQC